MKKVLLTLMILAALTLTACGGRAVRNRYDAFAAELAGRESLSYTAELRAEYPDRSVCFTLRYEKDAGGERVTVLAPALIEGISARVTEEGTALQYEGMILDTPPLDPYGLTPMNALPRLTEALRHGHPDSHWEEDGMTVLRLIPDDHLTAEVWFREGMIPARAELASDGKVSVFLELNDWS